jgi:hypothetical protein
MRAALIRDMLNLQLGQTQFIYLTLRETESLTSPNYLMRFVQRTTNAEVRFVLLRSADVSPYPARYQKFSIDVDQKFCGEIGEYQYYIYEQASASNVELDLTGKLLEQGLCRLDPASDDVYTFTAYQTSNEFTTK